jgi:uncharacterized protein (DUF983 family)
MPGAIPARHRDRVNKEFRPDRDDLSRSGTDGTGREQKGRESGRCDSGFSFMKKSLPSERKRKKQQMTDAPTTLTCLMRGARRRCPACGDGEIFTAYLKRAERCPACGESFDGLDADDGPAWLTIGLVAHIVIPLLIYLEMHAALVWWQEGMIVMTATIVSALALLPVSKGIFIAALWLMKKDRI